MSFMLLFGLSSAINLLPLETSGMDWIYGGALVSQNTSVDGSPASAVAIVLSVA